jgi:hypothetical protein
LFKGADRPGDGRTDLIAVTEQGAIDISDDQFNAAGQFGCYLKI